MKKVRIIPSSVLTLEELEKIGRREENARNKRTSK
jgi:hypothetical protein